MSCSNNKICTRFILLIIKQHQILNHNYKKKNKDMLGNLRALKYLQVFLSYSD